MCVDPPSGASSPPPLLERRNSAVILLRTLSSISLQVFDNMKIREPHQKQNGFQPAYYEKHHIFYRSRQHNIYILN